jgi:hypothetical protein
MPAVLVLCTARLKIQFKCRFIIVMDLARNFRAKAYQQTLKTKKQAVLRKLTIPYKELQSFQLALNT